MAHQERTLYCGNLSDKVSEDLLYELFLQAGPLESVKIPKEKDGRQKNFGFITFKHSVSVPYSIALMSGISLFGRNLRLDTRGGTDVPNLYMEQLRQYQQSHQDNRMHNNNRGRRQDSRRNNRTDNDVNQFDSRNVNPAMQGLYAGYNQQYMMPMNVAQGYPMNYGVYPNQWNQHFR